MEATRKHFAKMPEWVEGDISVEVIATELEAMMEEAQQLVSIDPRIVIKAPATETGLKLIYQLSRQGIKTNCTLVFSVLQALAAMKAGATYVSPFVGRLEDRGIDGLGVIEQMVQMKRNYGYETEILCASVRTQHHLHRCIAMGVDIVTCPYDFVLEFYHHPQTEEGLQKFLNDYHRASQSLVSA